MIKKYIIAVLLLTVFLAAFIPLSSSNPDGLDTVTSSLGMQSQPIWQGFMSEYSISALGNGYASTLVAGLFGVMLVLTATFALGKAISKRS